MRKNKINKIKILILIITIFLVAMLIISNKEKSTKDINSYSLSAGINENSIRDPNIKIKVNNIPYNQLDTIYESDSLKNKGEKEVYPNYTKISQPFLKFNNKKESISEIYKVNLTESLISLSAHTFDKNPAIELQYRIFFDGKWSEWEKLPNDKEGNPERNVFGLLPIYDNFEKIQFKSNTLIENVMFFLL